MERRGGPAPADAPAGTRSRQRRPDRHAGHPARRRGTAGIADHRRKTYDLIRLALDIADPALADRLAAALADVPGVQLVGPGVAADASIVAAAAAPSEVDVPLTPRELEVLALLAEGASNKTIARRLGISVHTAKFHVGSLLDKLDAVGRTDAVAHAARRGVIHL
ncbi:helix-turn-helix transcriptional regulator [Reyranella sp. CPCC 100927]|nr:helix-turn-helix transcriptional regulator [Reyranella sp. CPCC 100927]